MGYIKYKSQIAAEELESSLLKRKRHIVLSLQECLRALEYNPNDPPFDPDSMAERILELIDQEVEKVLKTKE